MLCVPNKIVYIMTSKWKFIQRFKESQLTFDIQLPFSFHILIICSTKSKKTGLRWSLFFPSREIGDTTYATSGARTAYPSEHLSTSPVFSGVRVARPLVFCIMFCRSLFLLLSILAYLTIAHFFRSVYKHGHTMQFLFRIGWFLKKKSPSLKPLGQMNRNLIGSIYGRSL